jgi:Response regulator of the LytR/AlgR family
MVSIIICEDNREQRLKIQAIIESHILIESLPMQIGLITDNPQSVLEYSDDELLRIYFLDIDLASSINGIELAAEIRKTDKLAKIVFITTESEMLSLIFEYKLEAMDFISKDDACLMKTKIKQCLDFINKQYLSEDKHDKEAIRIKVGNIVKVILIDDILYFETTSTAHRLKLTCKNSSLDFYGNIKDVEQLSEKFVKVHRAYVVNEENVVEVNRKSRQITFIGGEEIYGSARTLKNLKK